MRIVLVVFGTFVIYLTLQLSFNSAVEIKFTNAVCSTYNESLFLIHECRLRAVNRSRTTFNFNGTFLHPVNSIKLNFEMFQKLNGYKPWLYNITIDVCQFLLKPYNPVALLLYKVCKEFTNFNHTCPYTGPQIVDGLYLQPKLLRLPFPTGEYLIKMNWIVRRNITFTTNVYFKYVED